MTSWKDWLIPGHVFASGKPKAKKDPYADLLAVLNPLIEQNTRISGAAGEAGLANTAEARAQYDYVLKFLRNLQEGSPDSIMKYFDAGEVTRSSDDQEQQLSEFGIRGGRRAAGLAQTGFNRDSAFNRMISQLRLAAPGQIASIAQAIGNLGVGELSASVGASGQASGILFGIEGLKQADKDRKAELIGSIFEAIGAVGGAVACWSLSGSHIYVPSGKVASTQIEVGDEVISFDKTTGEKIFRKVIRTRRTLRQLTRIISNGNTIIRVTPTHQFYDLDFDKVLAANLDNDDMLAISNGGGNRLNKPIKIMGEEFNDVMIVKLDDENESYPIIVNGYLCEDDDPIN